MVSVKVTKVFKIIAMLVCVSDQLKQVYNSNSEIQDIFRIYNVATIYCNWLWIIEAVVVITLSFLIL